MMVPNNTTKPETFLFKDGYDIPVYGLTNGMFYYIHIPAIVCLLASLSCAVATIVLSFKRGKAGEFFTKWSKRGRLVVYISACDGMFCVSHLMDHLQILFTLDHVRPKELCAFYGFVMTVFVVAQILIVNVVAVNAFVMMFLNKKISFGKYDSCLIIWAFGVPIFGATVAATYEQFGPMGIACLYDAIKGHVANMVLTTIPVPVILVANIVLYILTFIRIRSDALIRKYRFGTNANAVGRHIKAAKRMLMFVFAFVFQWWCFGLFGAWSLFVDNPLEIPEILNYFGVVFTNLGGVFNLVVYLLVFRNKSKQLMSKSQQIQNEKNDDLQELAVTIPKKQHIFPKSEREAILEMIKNAKSTDQLEMMVPNNTTKPETFLFKDGYDIPVYGLANGMFYYIHIPAIVCLLASLSCAVATIVLSFKRRKAGEFFTKWSKGERLVVYISTCDGMFCASHLMDHLQILFTLDHVRPKELCAFYGFVMTVFVVAQILIVNVVAVHVFVMMFLNKKISFGKYDSCLIIWAFGVPIFGATVAATYEQFGPMGIACLYDAIKGHVANMVLTTIPVPVILVANIVLYILTFIRIRSDTLIRKYRFGTYANAVGRHIKAAKRMLMFVCAFVLQWWCFGLFGAWSLFVDNPLEIPEILNYFGVVFTNLGDVFNLVVYLLVLRNKSRQLMSKPQQIQNEKSDDLQELAHLEMMVPNSTTKPELFDLPVYWLANEMFYYIHIPAIVCLLASLSCAVATIVLFFKRRNAGEFFTKWSKGERLVVYISTCDGMFCASHLIDHLQILFSLDHVRPKELCAFYGFIMTLFVVAQILIVNVVAVNVFVMMFLNKKFSFGKYDSRLLIWAFVVPFTGATVAATYEQFGPMGVSCYYDAINGHVANMVLTTIPVPVILVINIVLYILNFIRIRSDAINRKQVIGSNTKAVRRHIKAAKGMSMFVLAFVIQCWCFGLFGVWSLFVDSPLEIPVIFNYIGVVFTNLGGILNLVVYLLMFRSSQILKSKQELFENKINDHLQQAAVVLARKQYRKCERESFLAMIEDEKATQKCVTRATTIVMRVKW
ncbi:hypothetical protein MAR_005018 [Mya arenaria]|uniref:G-protein coupled receptors family 1 profile domain-containing protein n=1 Tax=Mya arenaria TaxID=6604 RepID=A0ABY7EY99_MYAAR|nr:hypothetical protein MAR_005018 [Mya arenaria]